MDEWMVWGLGGEGIPLVSSEARKLSWPEANAGWKFGVPPSVPSLS